jgi:small subunit ribosomal protein S20
MPVTQSAKKALRRDKRRTAVNKRVKARVKARVDSVLKKATKKNLAQAYSVIDRAAKKKVIHKNKAARLKSRLAKS